MRHSTRRKLTGGLYLAPAVLFVMVFTAYPLSQMIWMSFHNWSLIAPKRWVGLDNFIRAYGDLAVVDGDRGQQAGHGDWPKATSMWNCTR